MVAVSQDVLWECSKRCNPFVRRNNTGKKEWFSKEAGNPNGRMGPRNAGTHNPP